MRASGITLKEWHHSAELLFVWVGVHHPVELLCMCVSAVLLLRVYAASHLCVYVTASEAAAEGGWNLISSVRINFIVQDYINNQRV